MLSTRVIENYTTSVITSLTQTTYIFRSIIRFWRASYFCDEARKLCVLWICGKEREKERRKIRCGYARSIFLLFGAIFNDLDDWNLRIWGYQWIRRRLRTKNSIIKFACHLINFNQSLGWKMIPRTALTDFDRENDCWSNDRQSNWMFWTTPVVRTFQRNLRRSSQSNNCT